MINSVSAKISFGSIIPISTVIVNGQSVTDKKITDAVTRQLVRQIKNPSPENDELRQILESATKDKSLLYTGHYVKKVGKYLLTGYDAIRVHKMWSMDGVDRKTKAEKVSEYVKSLFKDMPHCKLSIWAEGLTIKKKDVFNVKRLFHTIY